MASDLSGVTILASVFVVARAEVKARSVPAGRH